MASQRIKGLRPWSCLASCFAFMLKISEEKLYEELGHDGSEIFFPMASEPHRRRGFNLQEMMQMALRYKTPCYFIEEHPAIEDPTRWCDTCRTNFAHPVPNVRNVLDIMKDHSGILCGMVEGKAHAMVWDHERKRFLDPKGRVMAFDDIQFTVDFFCAMPFPKE